MDIEWDRYVRAGDTGIIVTERGVADLRGCTRGERRERLLAVASEP